MTQPYFNPVEFGEAEAARLSGVRADLLSRHQAPEPDDEDEGDNRSPAATLLVAILAAISGAVVMFMALSLSGWVH